MKIRAHFNRLSLLNFKALARDFINRSFTLRKWYLQYATKVSTAGKLPLLAEPGIKIEKHWRELEAEKWQPYLEESNHSELFLSDIINLLSPQSPIIDLGCGTGRTLNYLYNKGFTNLTGVEISPTAVRLMAEHYPQVYKNSFILTEKLPDCLWKFASKSFDLVFCQGLIVNIPSSANSIFSEMARLSRRFILIQSQDGSWNAYPRDLEKIFKRLGWIMVSYKIVTRDGSTAHIIEPFRKEDIFKRSTIRLFVADES